MANFIQTGGRALALVAASGLTMMAYPAIARTGNAVASAKTAHQACLIARKRGYDYRYSSEEVEAYDRCQCDNQSTKRLSWFRCSIVFHYREKRR